MKKICVVTATRAEYDGLFPLIKKIKKQKYFSLQLVVTGAHLSKDFGLTYKKIQKDGFKIHKEINMLSSDDKAVNISKAMAIELEEFSRYLAVSRPDIIVILGDRYELLPICIAAMNELIPVAHISGGEITEGALDDQVRHAVTKFSFLHFTANKKYRKRVIQLGENPNRVFAFGELSIENIKKEKLLSKEELKKELGFELDKPYALITFHPVTLENNTAGKQFAELLRALDATDLKAILTKSNADIGGRIINKIAKDYAKKKFKKAILFDNLGRILYLSAMKHAELVLGNSSSGICEAPSFSVPTVNIGDRQKGRIQSKTTVNCQPNYSDILNTIKEVRRDSFRKKIKNAKNPYENKSTSGKIIKTLKNFLSKKNITLKKKFYDIKF
ncbi:MAG: UDP-N-acetylglucosamine 2-epimerase [Oscillospiraceae bacterium]|jgi:GDP/UDP-N,N'-diacetylbacillosamine 2-epimerase (hydrolysing)|nr:UDP-N-acetylglucosamine 2-epimerase [Oscillospiraceae bacterium]